MTCCRVSGDFDEVNALKVRCCTWQLPASTSADPHPPASLLKLWFRELSEPLIPRDMYLTAVTNCDDVDASVALVSELPPLNRLVLGYLIHFLQVRQLVSIATSYRKQWRRQDLRTGRACSRA